MQIDIRKLIDLISVGPATVKDFHVLGITSVEQLKNRSGDQLYMELCKKTGVQHDICCLDVFNCAVAQARDSELAKEKCSWWYWSKIRKLDK